MLVINYFSAVTSSLAISIVASLVSPTWAISIPTKPMAAEDEFSSLKERSYIESREASVDGLTALGDLTMYLSGLMSSGLQNNSQNGFANSALDATFYQNYKTMAAQTNFRMTSRNSGRCGYSGPITEGTTDLLFLTTRVQGVVLAAYLGVGGSASISMFARHQSYIRQFAYSNSKDQESVSFPTMYDTPLTPVQAYNALYGITGQCPPPTGLTTVLGIQYNSPAPVTTGSTFSLLPRPGGKQIAGGTVVGAFITGSGFVYFDVTPSGTSDKVATPKASATTSKPASSTGSATVPLASSYTGKIPVNAAIGGQSYIVLTQGRSKQILAGPYVAEILAAK